MNTSSSSARPQSASSIHIWSTLKEDCRNLAADVERHGVYRPVGQTLANVEAFYFSDEDRRLLAQMGPVKRWFQRSWWFVKAMLLKLTSARRIMLALALAMALFGVQRFNYRTLHVEFRFSLLSGVLLFTVLALELKDKLLARDELEAGRKVQLALMPTEIPSIPGWDVWLYTQPANDVGGDLIDHLAFDEVRHGIALGDVAGKALPAALLSVKLQATLRALAPQCPTLSALGDEVNRIFCRDGLPSRFASLVYLDVRAGDGHVRVLNAGHMPPIVSRADSASTMERGSVVLGIMENATFPEQSVDLQPGDTLVVYSDGASEAMNAAGDFFGDDRIQSLAHASRGLSAREVGERIRLSVAQFIGEQPPNDDVSLMVLRRL